MTSPGRFERLWGRIKQAFARKPPPAVIGTPQSQRQVPADAGLHAVDFSRRYAQEMDYLVMQRMTDLGIPDGQIGSRPLGGPPFAFWPEETTGGGNGAGGSVNVYSGVFNPELDADRITPEAA